MCSAGVTMKGRRAFVSKVLSIPQCGHRKNLLRKTLKSQISELLVHSGVLPDSLHITILEDPTSEKNKRLTQKLAAMLETLDFSKPTWKESNKLKIMDKGDGMNTNYLTVKASKAAISQTRITAGCGTPKQWKPVAVSSLNAIFSSIPMANECITKEEIKPSSPQRIGRLKIIDKPLDSKEPLVTPRLMVQQQNLFTDPLLGSISSHVPHQPHTEEPKEDMKMSNKILKNLTQQLKKISNEQIISDKDHMPRSIEKLLLLIKEQEKRRKKSRGGKKIEVTEDIKTTVRKSIQFLNYSPSRTQPIDTVKSSDMFMQRYGTEPTRRMGTLWREQRLCVQGISLDNFPKVRCQNRRRTASTENILYQKSINMKVRKTTSARLFNIRGYRTLSFKKALRHSMKTQKELPQENMGADLLWKELCASGYIASQIKKLMEVRPQKPYIPPHMTLKKTKSKRLSDQPIDNNSVSSTVRKSSQYSIKDKEHQMVLLDIIPQNKHPLMTGQQVKELRHTNFNSHWEQEAYHVSGTGETDYSRFDVQKPRKVTDLEFSTAQSIKPGVLKDPIKHSLSISSRRRGPKKSNISSSQEHDIFLMKQDKVQELLKQSTTRVGLGSVVCPVKESFDSKNTNIPKKVGICHVIKNVSHLSRRKGLRETDTELGSKAQASLCTDLEDLQKTGPAQRDYTKSTQKPRVILNSVHCHKRAPFSLKPILSTTMKDSGVGIQRDLKGKERAEPADSLLKVIRQKVDSSKKLRPKYLTIFIQNKEQILQFFLSCILIQLQTENTQKQISAKAALQSKLLKPVVEVNILGDQSSSSGVSLHTNRGKDWPKNACKAFPMFNTQSLMDIQRITPPHLKKALKTVGSLDYHTLNTENGEQKRSIKELEQHHLSFSFKNLEEDIFDSPNCSYVQSHLEPQTKETLSEVGNMSSRTKELALSSKDQRRTVCECKPRGIFPSVIPEQTKKEDKVLLLESSNKTIKCPSLLLSKRKQSSESESVLNDSSPMIRISEKDLLSHKAIKKKREELYLSELFLHCLPLYMQCLYENEKLKGNIEYGVMKDVICLEKKAINLKRLELPPSRSTDYAQSNKAEPQCYKKEKMICMKHRNDKPGSIVIKVCEPIPLPHFKLDKEKVDVIISSNVRHEKYKSQEEETGIKEMKMDETIGSSISLKTKESALSYSSSGKKLTLCFDTTKQDKVQEKLSKSDMKPTTSFISLPSLSHPNLNSRIKVGKDKSRLLKDCLPPLKSLPSLKGRKVPFSNPFNRDNVCDLIELNYIPQRKEFKNNIPHLKDIIGLKHIAPQGKKPNFKHLLHGKEPWWHNKIQKSIQGNKTYLDVVQNKPWDSLPSSHFLEWDLRTKEAYLKRIMKFCLGSPALLELSGAIGMYQQLIDGLLSSIEKTNHMPLKKRLQTESKEVIHSSRPSLRQKMSSAPQELQFDIEKKEKRIHEDKKIKNWNKPSIYSLSYSQVDTRVNGEEAMQIRTQSSSHCSKLQTPSDIGEIVYKTSTFEPVLNSVKCSLASVIQKEECTKTGKSIHLKENQSVSQKIQLDNKEIGKDTVVTYTSTWTQTDVNENLGHLQERKCKLGESLALASLPHRKLDIEIKGKENTCIKIGSCSLHSQSMESSDAAEKLYFAASSLNDIISDPKRSRCLSYKEEGGVHTFGKISMHPKVKHVNRKKLPISCAPKLKRFKVDLGEQNKKKHESSREKVMLLRETCSVSTSSDVFKLDRSEEVETETMQSHVPYPVLQKSLPVGQVGSTKTIDNNFTKRKLHPPWEEEVQTSAIENLTYLRGPISMTKISAPIHVFSLSEHGTPRKRKTLHEKIKKKIREKQEKARKFNMYVMKSDSCMPSRVSKNKDILGKIQFSPPPSQVKDASHSNKTRYMKSSGYVLRNIKEPTQEEGRNRFRKDMKDEKVKKLPQSYALTIKELQSKTQGGKLLDLARTVVKLSTSQLQLNTFSGSQIGDRKVYSEIKLLEEQVPQKEKVGKKKHAGVNSIVVHPKNIHLKTKRSPILRMQNLSDFQWKTRKQGGKVKEIRSDSGITLTKKLTATSPQPISVNTRIKEECASMSTRPSVSMGYFQKSKDSEEGIYIQSITGNSPISIHSEKHISEEKEKAGMQIAKPITVSDTMKDAKKREDTYRNEKMCKTVQVVEVNQHLDGLESKPSSQLPQIVTPLTDKKKITHKEDMCTNVERGKQYSSQNEKRIDMTIEIPFKMAKVSPVTHLLNEKKLVLNMKVLEKKAHETKSELTMVASRTFLSIPSPHSINSQDKTQKGTAGFKKSPHQQENYQEPSYAQDPATIIGEKVIVNTPLQKCDSRPQGTISEDNSYNFYLKHIKMNLKSPKVDTIHANLKNNYERDFPSLSCVKTPTTNVSSSHRKALTEPKDIEKQESVTPLASLSNLPFIHVLHKFSEKEKDNLLGHFGTKTVEIQTMGLPSIAAKSYTIANGQDKSKPLFKCIHSAMKGPKQTNQVLVLLDEKSLSEIDCDLQHKYLCSLPNLSVPVVSVPNALPQHTSKLSKGSGSECKKADGSEESSTFSSDKKLLQHVSLPKRIPQESSLCVRKFQQPTNVPAFYHGLGGTKQNDIYLSDLKLQMTREKNKTGHVWFQETSAYKHSVSGTQQNTADLANSLSSWISDGTNVPLNTETSTDKVECQSPEKSDSEESVFIETNFYLTQDSQNFLSEVPKGIALADILISDREKYLKPFSHQDPNDSHKRTHTKHIFPVAQPFYDSQSSRKCRSNLKMQPPDWLSHSSSSTMEIESSTTELSLATTHGKYPQLNRKKARSDSHYSHSCNKEKQKKKRQTHAHWQNINTNQPFFYICVPADSMDVIPQTMRWVIPQKILNKGNFLRPQVANFNTLS